MGLFDNLFGDDDKSSQHEDLTIRHKHPVTGETEIEIDVQKDVVDPISNIFGFGDSSDRKKR